MEDATTWDDFTIMEEAPKLLKYVDNDGAGTINVYEFFAAVVCMNKKLKGKCPS